MISIHFNIFPLNVGYLQSWQTSLSAELVFAELETAELPMENALLYV
jgi:hypothetical protein